MELQLRKKTIKIGDKEVVLRELTAEEYDQLEEKLNEYLFLYGGDMREIGVKIVKDLTGLDEEFLKKNLSPRMIDEIIWEVVAMSHPKHAVQALEKIREDFFAMVMRALKDLKGEGK